MVRPKLDPIQCAVFSSVAELVRMAEVEGVELFCRLRPTNQERKKLDSFRSVYEESVHCLLGNDFVSCRKMTEFYGFSYSQEQLESFHNSIPDYQTIMWLRMHNYMLVAGPPNNLNLLETRELDTQLFFSKLGGWYAEENEQFSRSDVVEAGKWLAVRKKPYLTSSMRTWDQQVESLNYEEGQFVPNAAEAIYAFIAHNKINGIRALSDFCARTSSVNTNGNHVVVGNVGILGVIVSDFDDNSGYAMTGIASARTL